MNKMSVWSAIAEMRRLTVQDIPFSFEHSTWDRHRRKSSGIKRVDKAILRPQAKSDDILNADHKLFYKDIGIQDTQDQNRNCWQCLLISFNGTKLYLP